MRADRLLSLMLLLQTRGRMTAADLAAQLEVSERTIYRDLDALSTAGVPVYTQPGVNGGVYLDEHYRVSLNGLTTDEVQALFVSGKVAALTDLGLGKAVENTLLKLFAALPSTHRAEVERLRQRFHIDAVNWFQVTDSSPHFADLQRAVWEDRVVEIVYHPYEHPPITRTVEAYALVAKANIWYLVSRKPGGEFRHYRLSRLKSVTLTDERFARDPAFDLAAYWEEACRYFETNAFQITPPYVAVLRIPPALLEHFVTFMPGRFAVIEEDAPDGWLCLRVQFYSIDEARMRVLGLGTRVEVVEPGDLLATVLETAASVLAFYREAIIG